MPFTEGRHRVRIASTGLGESPKTKSEQIIITFEDVADDYNTITAYLATSEKAWPYTEKSLINCGWDPTFRGYLFEELNEDPSPIAGNEVDIVTEEEEYEGKRRMKVKWINAPGAGIERMEPAEAQSFAERLRARLLSGNAQPKRNGNAQPATEYRPKFEDSTVGEDDLPFSSHRSSQPRCARHHRPDADLAACRRGRG